MGLLLLWLIVPEDVEEIVDHEKAQKRLKNLLHHAVDHDGWFVGAVAVALTARARAVATTLCRSTCSPGTSDDVSSN